MMQPRRYVSLAFWAKERQLSALLASEPEVEAPMALFDSISSGAGEEAGALEEPPARLPEVA